MKMWRNLAESGQLKGWETIKSWPLKSNKTQNLIIFSFFFFINQVVRPIKGKIWEENRVLEVCFLRASKGERKLRVKREIGSALERRNRSGDKVSHLRSKEPHEFKFKQGNFRLGELNPKSYLNCTVLYDFDELLP